MLNNCRVPKGVSNLLNPFKKSVWFLPKKMFQLLDSVPPISIVWMLPGNNRFALVSCFSSQKVPSHLSIAYN